MAGGDSCGSDGDASEDSSLTPDPARMASGQEAGTSGSCRGSARRGPAGLEASFIPRSRDCSDAWRSCGRRQIDGKKEGRDGGKATWAEFRRSPTTGGAATPSLPSDGLTTNGVGVLFCNI